MTNASSNSSTSSKNSTTSAATILDGRATAKAVRGELAEVVGAWRQAHGEAPGLAVVLVGDDPASQIYVRHKIRACQQVGIVSTTHRLQDTTTEAALLALIDTLNADDSIDGILVQLPLPGHIDAGRVTERVAPGKDVDGFGTSNVANLALGRPALHACTPAGVMELLRRHEAASAFRLQGANAVVVGRSQTVGLPMALLLIHAHATVTVCHSRTRDLAAQVGRADVLVVAAGRRHLVSGHDVKPGAVVVDVGIHRNDDGSLSGDVDFDAAAARASAITPVPGGVGPMTVAMLMHNTVQAAARRRGWALPS